MSGNVMGHKIKNFAIIIFIVFFIVLVSVAVVITEQGLKVRM
ncbi:MAG: hypothetical protein ACYC56_03300 [Candidatus Aquicultor sp.]